ncbi:MAG: hypothetical protein K5756_01405 [Clostridiales bacterium]|nr:hypothetical protein [Clostridiales bacterium]
MSEISALPGTIVEWLNDQEVLSDISFMTEFPAAKKAVPLKRAVVAVGIDKLDIVDSFSDDGEGNQIRNEYCREANIKIRLAIHAPFSQGGNKCFEVFTNVLDCLTFSSNMNIIDSGCDAIKADRDTEAFVLNARVNVKADFCPAISGDINFASFISRDLFCGSHINDDQLHIMPGERDKWNSPFIVGQYFGNGASTRAISLQFVPKAVIAFAYGYPACTHDSVSNTAVSRFAVAAGDYGMMGMHISSTGFTVSNSSSEAVDNCSPDMNEMGTIYTYIAFR